MITNKKINYKIMIIAYSTARTKGWVTVEIDGKEYQKKIFYSNSIPFTWKGGGGLEIGRFFKNSHSYESVAYEDIKEITIKKI